MFQFFFLSIVIAAFFACMSEARHTVRQAANEDCEPLNVCFAIDESGSIDPPEFLKQTEYVIALTKAIAKKAPGSSFSAAGFASNSKEIQAQTTDVSQIEDALFANQQTEGSTASGAGLNTCDDLLGGAASPKLIILITDGEDTAKPEGIAIAPGIKAAGTKIATVGVGAGVNEQDLKAIASDPSLFTKVTNFDALDDTIDTITDETCVTPPLPPSPKPTPTKLPTPSPAPPTIHTCGCTGDPHCTTFDGLRFDSQGTGEFVLSNSTTSSFQVQARFGAQIDGRVTLTQGIAMKVPGSPVTQVSIARGTSAIPTTIAGCQVVFFVDGIARSIDSGSGTTAVTVTRAFENILILYNDGGVSMSLRPAVFNGKCYLEGMQLSAPSTFLSINPLLGLLGSPNGNPFDDWTDKDGNVLPIPSSDTELRSAPAYEYSVQNWCVEDASTSLFTYEDGTSHSTFYQCQVPFGGTTTARFELPDVIGTNTPSKEVIDLCGEDANCLIDGTFGGIIGAQVALNEIDNLALQREKSEILRFLPSSLRVEERTTVKIIYDARSVPEKERALLTGFRIRRVDPLTGKFGKGVTTLRDNGAGTHLDDEKGDGVFSGMAVFRELKNGISISFVAVPFINTSIMRNSPLVRYALNAITVYTRSPRVSCPANGTPNLFRNVCCPLACGTCDGADCANAPGGSAACCRDGILRSRRFCFRDNAPCRL